MTEYHLTCEVCYCSVPMKPDHLYGAHVRSHQQRPCPICLALVRAADLDDHLRWHRTLRNIPLDSESESD